MVPGIGLVAQEQQDRDPGNSYDLFLIDQCVWKTQDGSSHLTHVHPKAGEVGKFLAVYNDDLDTVGFQLGK